MNLQIFRPSVGTGNSKYLHIAKHFWTLKYNSSLPKEILKMNFQNNQIICSTFSNYKKINFNHRKTLLCAHWNSHDHLSHSVVYKKSFTVQTMDKCWPFCDIYEFQLSFSPGVPIFCMVICWQIFIVILGPERPEEMHLKIHTGKVGRTIMKLQNSEFISAPTVWPCSDATVWGCAALRFLSHREGPSWRERKRNAARPKPSHHYNAVLLTFL